MAKKLSYLGVDLGAGSIKLVELGNDGGRARLVTYGFTEENFKEKFAQKFIDDPEKTARLLKEICKKAKTTTTSVIAALPSSSVFSSIINLPKMPEKELAAAIELEAKKIIPLPIEEMKLDWEILPSSEEKKIGETVKEEIGKNTQIFLTGASKNLARKYLEIFKKAELNLISLETDGFALTRSLIGQDKSVISIVDIGAASTNISIIDKGLPLFNRSLDLGGMAISRGISSTLAVEINEAEGIKHDLSLFSKNSFPALLKEILIPLVDEIKYCLNLYKSQGENEGKGIEKIILSGGSALLDNLSGYLSSILNMRVYAGDPWARVIYPEELKPVLDEIGPRFSIAVGLAMREIE